MNTVMTSSGVHSATDRLGVFGGPTSGVAWSPGRWTLWMVYCVRHPRIEPHPGAAVYPKRFAGKVIIRWGIGLCPVFLHRVRRSNRLYIREPVDTALGKMW